MRIAQEAADIAKEVEREKNIAEIALEVENEKKAVIHASGAFIIGTERHESRRIDNQLRGRSGRQGDPGTSKFFLSLEDDLMRIFGSERMDSMLRKLGLKEGEAIVHPWINKALEKAQQKVEARNFDIRKNLLRFDDVMNDQRKVIYEQRIELMRAEDVAEDVADMRKEVVETLCVRHVPEKSYADQWETETLRSETQRVFDLDLPFGTWAAEEGVGPVEIRERLEQEVDRKLAEKAANYGRDLWRMVEKNLLLQLLDQHWKDHLLALDHLRQGIGLRAYGQRDPLNEYKSEAFALFESMLIELREHVTTMLAHVELHLEHRDGVPPASTPREPVDVLESHIDPITGEDEMALTGGGPGTLVKERPKLNPADPSTWGKVPRNSPCPCGSERKYKHCHGQGELKLDW